mmetsp:Transcript_4623/g.19702  ORF Transcript_4623/g.19702 Transcript_4623/m.19702 type:complete len:242 (-) Transcript_4623:362-1087(-)
MYSWDSASGLVSSYRNSVSPALSHPARANASLKLRFMLLACPMCRKPLGSGGKRVRSTPPVTLAWAASSSSLLRALARSRAAKAAVMAAADSPVPAPAAPSAPPSAPAAADEAAAAAAGAGAGSALRAFLPALFFARLASFTASSSASVRGPSRASTLPSSSCLTALPSAKAMRGKRSRTGPRRDAALKRYRSATSISAFSSTMAPTLLAISSAPTSTPTPDASSSAAMSAASALPSVVPR